jgi:hypothetical protein
MLQATPRSPLRQLVSLPHSPFSLCINPHILPCITLTHTATFVGYCVGNMIGPVCFSSTPGPVYQGGFIACVVATASVMLVAIFGRWYLGRENARRDREYGTPDNSHALEDVTDRENMNFRYML